MKSLHSFCHQLQLNHDVPGHGCLEQPQVYKQVAACAVVDLSPVLGGSGPWGGTCILHPVHGVHAHQGAGGLAHLAGGLLDPGQLPGSWPCLACARQSWMAVAHRTVIHTVR